MAQRDHPVPIINSSRCVRVCPTGALTISAGQAVVARPMVTLQPGEALKRHVTPVDVFFYVLEGEGIVEIDDEQEHVSRDMLIDSPARIPHRLLNDGDEVFRFLGEPRLWSKTLRPTESTRVL